MTPASIPERFNGFPQGAFEFFEELGRHNERDWFRAHQEVYERECREPMKLLVAELTGAVAGSYGSIRNTLVHIMSAECQCIIADRSRCC